MFKKIVQFFNKLFFTTKATSKAKRVYLCGSMSGLKNYGAGWRKRVKKHLLSLGYEVFDPCVEEAGTPDWESMTQSQREGIILKDIGYIDKQADLVVCYFTGYSTGTVSELTHAFYKGIPIHFISRRPPKKWPGTIYSSWRNDKYSTIDEFIKYFPNPQLHYLYTQSEEYLDYHSEIFTARSLRAQAS